MTTLLIRNAQLGDDPSGAVGDLLLRDGAIAMRGPLLEFAPVDGEEHEELDATGLVALPGAIDAFAPIGGSRTTRSPADDLGSGTIAAARGGVTTIISPIVPASGETPLIAFRDACGRASGNVFVDWGFMLGLGRPAPTTANEVRALIGEPGLVGAFLDLDASDESATAGPGALLRIASLAGLPIMVRAAGRLGARAEQHRLRTLGALGALADIRAHVAPLVGAPALGELADGLASASTSLAHLCLAELPDGMQVAPPLSSAEDKAALWQALADGTLEGVVSDHRPEPLSGSDGWIGLASIELMVPALLTHGVAAGLIDLPTLCAIIAERPARRLGLWPRKGSLAVGSDADIVLVDPAATWTVEPAALEGRGKAPAWHGRELTGRVVHVYSRGQQIVNDGFPLFRPGRGRPVTCSHAANTPERPAAAEQAPSAG